MTDLLYRTDPYLKTAESVVTRTDEQGVYLDRTIFFAQGGGQPGDSGRLVWGDSSCRVVNTVRGAAGAIIHLCPRESRPPQGTFVTQELDWTRRYAHMRMHTALHLLSVLIPLPVTGGAIGAGKSRLDFDMPDPLTDRQGIKERLNELVAMDLKISEEWISAHELRANPELVKTLSVKPPTDAGRVRLVAIGADDSRVDLQPCGGTHVARTGEVGPLRLGKIQKKGRQNRRVYLHLDS